MSNRPEQDVPPLQENWTVMDVCVALPHDGEPTQPWTQPCAPSGAWAISRRNSAKKRGYA